MLRSGCSADRLGARAAGAGSQAHTGSPGDADRGRPRGMPLRRSKGRTRKRLNSKEIAC